jgi:hypothetical protein
LQIPGHYMGPKAPSISQRSNEEPATPPVEK